MSSYSLFSSVKLLNAGRLVSDNINEKAERFVYDYELDYQIDGHRTVGLNEETFEMNAGDIIFRRPGDISKKSGPYNTYFLTIDFSNTPMREINFDRNIPKDIQPICRNPVIESLPMYFHTYHRTDFLRIYEQLSILNNTQKQANIPPDINNTYTDLINELFYNILSDLLHKKNRGNFPKEDYMRDSCRYIQDNYMKPLTLDEIAKYSNTSKSHFLKIFKAATSITPMQYLTSVRIQNAKNMLIETNEKINYIASVCGFNYASYFTQVFKNETGITPEEYREKYQL